MEDFDPLMAPTFTTIMDELRADKSDYSIGGIDQDLVTDVFNTYADSGADRTIGADRSAWKKWKAFCARNGIRRVWRDDLDANSGRDATGHRREIMLMRCFLIDTHRSMKPRRNANKRARPRSALNTLAGVRRIHKRAMINMVDGAALSTALKGLNRQYINAEGHNGALLEQRKEPITNDEAASMTSVPEGTSMRGWTVDWSSAPGVSFVAGLRAGRQGGFRKADLASLEDFQAHEMARANLTWWVDLRDNGVRVHVPELPEL